VALVTNPAMETGLPIWWLSMIRPTPWIYRIHDLYPDAIVRLGISSSTFVITIMQKMENYCYRHAELVPVVTERFRERLIGLGVPDRKLIVLPDWEDTDYILPMSRQNAFRNQIGVDAKFVVLYGGNIGRSQGLQTLIQAAERLSDNERIHFLVVGEGADKQHIMNMISEKKLQNVAVLSYQSADQIPQVYAAADVGLVMLRAGVAPEWVPAKTYSIMASGRPVLAVVDRDSACWELITTLKCGICVEPGDVDALSAAVSRLAQENTLLTSMGQAGRAYVLENASRQKMSRRIPELMKSVARESSSTQTPHAS
jgi:colanic acid biosynthesis glycosyl transferase WcaI